MPAAKIWSLAWLITLWVFTLGGTIIILIASGGSYLGGYSDDSLATIALAGTWNQDDNTYLNQTAWGTTLIVCASATIVINFVSVVRLAARKLTPFYVLASNAVCLFAWAVILVASALTPPGWNDVALIGNGILILTSIGQVIYSSVLYGRQRRMPATVDEEKDASPEEEATASAPAAPVAEPVAPVVNTVYVPVMIPRPSTIDDDDSGFEEPAPDYETVVGGNDGGVSGSGTQKFNDL
ncbi:unnamed protein product [Zymoseptoria tritici ST99CH_1A5]|uniref:MARVEL domain-containing protein n=2 Tax=Zymoseptoria tritici TaxID=1047171 RepID=A0A1X7S1X7_ZYMT9|nr:unnamed protein product [Zymoseptoria tritici ST99CH_3D7]SMR60123.1 unnamed protein product [Zymoseptoria tritici ST99CH_3D1]SMY27314.1 unnamed protein product [Zymoseptoria tritici ST99CH_1A5]